MDAHEHHDMSGHADHDGMDHGSMDHASNSMAVSATLHCLTGCSIGELAGMALGAAFGWHNVVQTAVSIVLAFAFGYTLSALPLVRAGVPVARASRLVLAADTVSILTMEVVDNLVMWLIPGAMNATLSMPLFWLSMPISLVAAFVAAYPVNKRLLAQGKGHAITHGAVMDATGTHAAMDNRPLVFGITAFLLGGLVASGAHALGLG